MCTEESHSDIYSCIKDIFKIYLYTESVKVNVFVHFSCIWPFGIWFIALDCALILAQFSYSGSDGISVHVVQLTFLQLLSATAKQTFTYNCLNSAAWLHSAPQSYQLALRFRGANGEELTHENTQYIRALYDGCRVRGAHLQLMSNQLFSPPINLLCMFSVIVTLRSGEDRVGIWCPAVQHTPHTRCRRVWFWKGEPEIWFPGWPSLLQWLIELGSISAGVI